MAKKEVPIEELNQHFTLLLQQLEERETHNKERDKNWNNPQYFMSQPYRISFLNWVVRPPTWLKRFIGYSFCNRARWDYVKVMGAFRPFLAKTDLQRIDCSRFGDLLIDTLYSIRNGVAAIFIAIVLYIIYYTFLVPFDFIKRSIKSKILNNCHTQNA